MIKLKPCPFCGSKAEVGEHMRVSCFGCGASPHCGAASQEASLWNQRIDNEHAATIEQQKTENAELRAEIERLKGVDQKGT